MLNHHRRRLLASLGAVVTAPALLLHDDATAQGYPAQPVVIVNPFAPGGSADVTARLLAAELTRILGGSFVVQNVAGAGGTIGSAKVAKSTPDGYTLLLSNVASQAIGATLYPNIPYDALKDFDHIALFGAFPNVLVVAPSLNVNSVSELIALARRDPGKLTFGSAGNGSTPHLSGEIFNKRAGISTAHVPFKGAGPALMAVMAGEITFQFDNIASAIPQIQAGRLKALAVTSANRMPVIPDVPTMTEQGMTDFVVTSWYGLSAPLGTPAPVREQLGRAMSQSLASPEMRNRLKDLGMEPSALTPAQYPAFISREIVLWRDVIRSSNATIS